MKVALLLALCACGDGIAALDAEVPGDATVASVVTVETHFDPKFVRAGTVYFQERDSTLALATRLDERGRASGLMHEGGFVTVVTDAGGLVQIYTYADVNPGDHLVFGRPTAAFAGIRLFAPTLPGASLTLETACTAGQLVSFVPYETYLNGCGENLSLFVFAHLEEESRYVYREGIRLEPFEVDNFVEIEIDGPYVPFTSNVVTVTNAPSSLGIEQGIAVGQGVVSPSSSIYGAVDGTVTSFPAQLPLAPNATSITTISNNDAASIVWQPAQADISIDWSAVRLRRQTQIAYYDPTTSSITWSEDATGVAPTHTVAQLSWDLYQWSVAAKRGDAARIDVPVLPDRTMRPTEFVGIGSTARVHLPSDAAIDHRLFGAWNVGERWPVSGERGLVAYELLR